MNPSTSALLTDLYQLTMIQAYLQTKQPLGPGPGTPEDCAERDQEKGCKSADVAFS